MVELKNKKALLNQKLAVEKVTKEQQAIMDKTHAEKKFLTLAQQRPHVKAIRNAIRNEERRLRKKHTWLANQDLIGISFFAASLFAYVLAAHLFLQGSLHWSITVLTIMFAGSILHELEHDLIHNLYFSRYPVIQHVLFALIYITKWNISPWYRKKIHLRHHIVSGQKEDIEERLIGLGRAFDLKRFITSTNHFFTASFTDEDSLPAIAKDSAHDYEDHQFSHIWFTLKATPTIGVVSIAFHVFMSYLRLTNGWTFGTYDPATYLPLAAWPYVRAFFFLVSLPNLVRNVCLNYCASYCHYYADIPENSVFYQNQILEHWIFFPLQLFCFNFGATHILHHYVPAQPFYLRQMCYAKTRKVLIEHGTRLNDLDVVRRRNRFYEYKNEHEMAKSVSNMDGY